jgi:hypothetical protein
MANATGFSLFFKTNYTVADAKVSTKLACQFVDGGAASVTQSCPRLIITA